MSLCVRDNLFIFIKDKQEWYIGIFFIPKDLSVNKLCKIGQVSYRQILNINHMSYIVFLSLLIQHHGGKQIK